MQQCDMCHPPQLVSYRCLAAAMGQSVMALSRLCPCPHTTHHHHITPHTTEPSQWWAWQRAGPGSAANPAAPRPAPARPGPSTAPDTAFRFHCPPQPAPARPRRRAGPALRTPHSHDPTYPAVGWLASMQSPPGPSTTTIAPC